MKIECRKLDWQDKVFGGENVVEMSLSCIDFDQALRFIVLLKNFVQDESVVKITEVEQGVLTPATPPT